MVDDEAYVYFIRDGLDLSIFLLVLPAVTRGTPPEAAMRTLHPSTTWMRWHSESIVGFTG